MLTTLILLAAASPAAAACRADTTAASSRLVAADAAVARGDYRAADSALDAGLREIGNSYVAPPTVDDTGMHLVLADSQKHRGRVRLAADLKRRVLVERLALCRRSEQR